MVSEQSDLTTDGSPASTSEEEEDKGTSKAWDTVLYSHPRNLRNLSVVKRAVRTGVCVEKGKENDGFGESKARVKSWRLMQGGR